MVARHCLKSGDFRNAIEFFLVAKRADEAFQVTQLCCACSSQAKLAPLGEYGSVVMMWVCLVDVLQVAREHDEMELYAEVLGADATQEDNGKIAAYYESRGKLGHVSSPALLTKGCGVCCSMWPSCCHCSGWQVLLQVWRVPQGTEPVPAVRRQDVG